MSFSDNKIDLRLLELSDKLIISEFDGIKYVTDPVRKKKLILQPEEMVRQLLILWFIEKTTINRNSLQVEKLIDVNHLSRRFDIVVYNREIQPYILVECKASAVPVTQNTFDQIASYNSVLRAPYLMVSNGHTTWFAHQDEANKQYTFYSEIPEWLLK
ncbi:MAG: type I restriction enzyme HsdR N-terminal domain-containing protein [Saprospiraceae bacterium]|nr:type I restriction enzyme HsdR N-terminal domain-containing protein [Saprospiraceae bacterium]MBL0025949.1 type I restriction enzyme HsdR N-terminal domain-containing protein [Saprospiraceae bacterium]